MKFHIVYQHDSRQCGVACLAMICKYYGKTYSLDYLSQRCPESSEGISMLALQRLAEEIGMHTICARADVPSLVKPLPAIIHWNQNHFVVLYKVDKDKRFYIADPGIGKMVYGIDEFRTHWISTSTNDKSYGIVMFIRPSSEFGADANESVKDISTNSLLFKYISRYKTFFFHIFLGLAAGSLFQLILPFLTQAIVDAGIKKQDIGLIWLILLGQFTLTLCGAALDYIRRWLLLHVSMRVNISLVSDFFKKLTHLPMFFFDAKQLGDILQRVEDHDRVERFLTQQVLNTMFSFVTFIVLGAVMAIYNYFIFLIFLLGSIVYGLWTASFMAKRKQIDYDMFYAHSKNNDTTFELITSMQEIKLQGCEERNRKEWADVQFDLYNVRMKGLRLEQWQESGCLLINELKNLIITVVSATSVIDGSLTLGMMLAIQYIIGQLNIPVKQFVQILYSFQDVRISLERISEIHKMEEEDYNKDCNLPLKMDEGIYFENVDFKYDRLALHKTIDNAVFHIPSGKVTAIVGASGSGKTTLVKLMLGYYKVLSGKLMIFGQDINKLSLSEWRKKCGTVMQDGVIFSDTIGHNIAVCDSEIDLHLLEEVSEKACIRDFINGLPLKYDTKIGRKGKNLSPGQRQRILIARALYKNPDVLFFDEATNSLDAYNEHSIVENLTEICKGKTVIVVAHRLSTVKNADQIIVMDGGKIVETGTHKTLIDKKGTYYNLVKNQLELGN